MKVFFVMCGCYWNYDSKFMIYLFYDFGCWIGWGVIGIVIFDSLFLNKIVIFKII